MEGYESVPRLEIGDDELRALDAILDRVRADHRARLVFLVESCGRPITVCGEGPCPDLDSVASLAASTAAAVDRLASLLGEGDVDLLLQRKGQDVLQLVPAGPLVLGVVFAGEPPAGVERVRARLRRRRAISEIQSILAHDPSNQDRPAALDGCEDTEIENFLAPMEPQDD